jgi:hypothetical protein
VLLRTPAGEVHREVSPWSCGKSALHGRCFTDDARPLTRAVSSRRRAVTVGVPTVWVGAADPVSTVHVLTVDVGWVGRASLFRPPASGFQWGIVAQSLAGGELGRTDYLCFFCGRSPALAGLGGYAAVLTQTSQPVTDKPLSSTGHLVTTASGRRARPGARVESWIRPLSRGYWRATPPRRR